MDNDERERRLSEATEWYELWLYFGDWTREGFAGTAEQVAADYGVDFDRMEGEAGVLELPRGSRSDAEYEGWETVRMGGVLKVEIRDRGELVGTWDHSGEPDEDGFDTRWTPAA